MILCDFIPGQSLWQLEWNENSLTASNLATITSFGEPLMEVVCRDASSGHDVTRVREHSTVLIFVGTVFPTRAGLQHPPSLPPPHRCCLCPC